MNILLIILLLIFGIIDLMIPYLYISGIGLIIQSLGLILQFYTVHKIIGKTLNNLGFFLVFIGLVYYLLNII